VATPLIGVSPRLRHLVPTEAVKSSTKTRKITGISLSRIGNGPAGESGAVAKSVSWAALRSCKELHQAEGGYFGKFFLKLIGGDGNFGLGEVVDREAFFD
jgi:hypothetical protein